MNHEPSTEPLDQVTAAPVARRLAAGLLAAFTLIVLLAFSDRARRSEIEAVHASGPAPRQR